MPVSSDLTKFTFYIPGLRITFPLILVVGLVVGVVSFLFQPMTPVLFRVVNGLVFGFTTLSLPAFISSGLNSFWLRGNELLSLKRSFFLSLVTELVLAFFVLVFPFLFPFFHVSIVVLRLYGFIAGCIVGFALQFLVLLVLSNLKVLKSVFSSSFQPGFSFLLLLVLGRIRSLEELVVPPFREWISLPRVIFAGVVVTLAVWAFLEVINAPLKTRYGIGMVEMLNYALSEAVGLSGKIEGAFTRIGEYSESLVSTLVFKAGKKLKAVITTPYIHPGPYGAIGGSNLPFIIMDELERRYGVECPIVLHGTCTPDLNPANKKENLKVVSAVNASVEEALGNEKSKASKLVEVKRGDFTVKCQIFGDYPLVIVTRSPLNTEDISFAVGWALMNRIRSLGFNCSAVVDAHNSIDSWAEPLRVNMPESFVLEEAVAEAVKSASQEINTEIRVGVSKRTVTINPREGVGPGGLRFLLIETGKEKFGYLLIDANNVIKGLREEILNVFLKEGLRNGEVLTDDSHIVNGFRSGFNPFGMRMNKEEILKTVSEMLKEAENNLEPCTFSCSMRKIRNILVLGTGKTNEFLSLVNSTVALTKLVAPLIFVFSIILIISGMFI